MQMMVRLRLSSTEVHLLGTSSTWGDVLKARLPLSPAHPRALLTVLEGLSLWSGTPLTAVIAAAQNSPSWHGSGLFGDELWPAESQLVRYEVDAPEQVKRLRGVGDFRALRRTAERR